MTARLNGKTLPDGWYWAYLPHLGELNRGKSKHRPRNDERLFGGPYPFIQTSDIRHANGILSTYSQTYSEFGLKQSRLWPAGTLCITIAANIAETAILGFDACFPDSIVGFIPSGEECNVKFVEYFFRTVQQDLENIAPATAQKNINLEVLSELAVPLPPPNEQQRIVEAIETQFTRLDAGVTALKRSQANLKRYRAAVLKAACEGRLVPTEVELAQAEGRSYEPATVLLDRILAERRKKWEAENPKKKYQEPVAPETSALPELPEGWAWATIDQATVNLDHMRVPVNKEERAERSGDIPYYGANGPVGWIDDYIFDEPLILVVEDETFTGREKPFCYKISGKSWVNNHAHVLQAKAVTTEYLNYSLSYYPFTPLTTGTTGRRKLTKNALLNASYAVPPMAEQLRIVAEVERRLSLIDQLEKTIETDLARANRLRQSILKRAFAGQLVPQDPHDEPAAVLLERMKAAKDGKSVQPALSTVKE